MYARPSLRLVPLLSLLLVSLAAAEPTTRVPARTPTLGALGPVDTWVLHYDPALGDVILPTMEDLLAAVHPESHVLVAVPSARAGRTVCSLLGITPQQHPQVEVLVVDGLVSGWARDRYISFERAGVPSLYVMPELEVPEGRQGDLAVGRALLERFPERRRLDSALLLEGGNCLLTDEYVFVGPQVLEQNLPRSGGDPDAVLAEVARIFGREVVLVGALGGPLPHEHIDMFLTALGPTTLLLGDPRLTRPYFDALEDLDVPEAVASPLGALSWQVQVEWSERYEAVNEELVRLGFVVERIPILHTGGDVVLTWNNAVLETRADVRTAFVPRYGIPFLDRLAAEHWRRLGWQVKPIRARLPIQQGGAVRCLANVVRRAAPAPEVPAPPLGAVEVPRRR